MGKILLYEDNQLCIHKPNSTGVGWKLSSSYSPTHSYFFAMLLNVLPSVKTIFAFRIKGR